MNLADNKSNEVSAVLLNNYLGLLSSLTLEYQMQLSQRLSYNISRSEKKSKISTEKLVNQFYGAWLSDKSAKDMLDEIKADRRK